MSNNILISLFFFTAAWLPARWRAYKGWLYHGSTRSWWWDSVQQINITPCKVLFDYFSSQIISPFYVSFQAFNCVVFFTFIRIGLAVWLPIEWHHLSIHSGYCVFLGQQKEDWIFETGRWSQRKGGKWTRNKVSRSWSGKLWSGLFIFHAV